MKKTEILKILALPKEIEEAVVPAMEKQEAFAEKSYLGKAPDFPICKKSPLNRLALVVLLLCKKYEEYFALGVPKNIIEETFRDVSLRAAIYYSKNGKPGITKNDAIWFRHIMNVNIFKVGALQFQPFEMVYLDEEFLGEPYMEFSLEQKEKLPANAQVINCHVQFGADLSNDLVNKSFSDAYMLFKRIFPKNEFKAFVCYSWLLYPNMTDLLPEDSKIKQFANHFDIVGTVCDSEQAFENLFGKAYKRIPKIKNATRLQKLAAQNPKAFGFACGIIYL